MNFFKKIKINKGKNLSQEELSSKYTISRVTFLGFEIEFKSISNFGLTNLDELQK